MIWLVGSLVYGGIVVVAGRLIAGHLAWRFHDGNPYAPLGGRRLTAPCGEQWFGAWFCALALAVIWPLALLPWLAGRRVAVGAEQQARARAREKRIKEIEQELGIR